jgi:ribosome production factor 1
MVQEMKAAKQKKKTLDRIKKKQTRLEKGDDAVPRGVTNTIESLRVYDETFITEKDDEIEKDDEVDEFAEYFKDKTTPKIMMTTSLGPHKNVFEFLKELKSSIPNLFYYERKKFRLKSIIEWAKKREFTDVMVVCEKKGKPHSMIISHLPNGPTATFKMSGTQIQKEIQHYGNPTEHAPQLVLNNFDTRVGYRIGRMIASLFPQRPEYEGRQVVTFHNQRDFIFFRRHRFEFTKDGQRANLQEIGPRFTLKLLSLQHGTFDMLFGKYEFSYAPKMGLNRKKFYM